MNGILKMFSIYIFGNFKPLSHFKKGPLPSLFTISQEYNISPAQYQQKNLLCPLKILPYSKMEETEWNKNMSECQTKAVNCPLLLPIDWYHGIVPCGNWGTKI